jgi:hypothetical protein
VRGRVQRSDSMLPPVAASLVNLRHENVSKVRRFKISPSHPSAVDTELVVHPIIKLSGQSKYAVSNTKMQVDEHEWH